MEKISLFTTISFIATTALTGWFFWKASNYSRTALLGMVGWLILTAALSLTGFYLVTDVLPPRLTFAVAPPLLLIALLFFTSKGRSFIDNLNVEYLVLLHVVRVPVELVLHALFVGGLIPVLMTYEGYNLDIISGVTAPAIYYFGYVKKVLSSTILLIWNFLCLGLLITIVTLAILSLPSPFQQLAFDQPTVGVLYFPFIWLPGLIVPLVLLAQVATIKSLLSSSKRIKSAEIPT